MVIEVKVVNGEVHCRIVDDSESAALHITDRLEIRVDRSVPNVFNEASAVYIRRVENDGSR